MAKRNKDDDVRVICNTCQHCLAICSEISKRVDDNKPFMGVCEITLDKVFLFVPKNCKNYEKEK